MKSTVGFARPAASTASSHASWSSLLVPGCPSSTVARTLPVAEPKPVAGLSWRNSSTTTVSRFCRWNAKAVPSYFVPTGRDT